MKKIEKKISYLVKNQFPSFYQEEGQNFIAFMEAYFEWLEQFGLPSENAVNHLYQARSLPQYRDIDETLDEFIVHFKEKYLKNIQFDTATNKTLLVKNSLDLYRSKGTERSIDLFFKLIYGTDATVSYPGDKLFKLSAANWVRPQYLEVEPNYYNVNYVGKQIVGSTSGAKAFVERYVKRKTLRGYVDVLHISNIEGNFDNNEVLGFYLKGVPVFEHGKTTKILGSVNSVIVENRGQNFKVGDIVDINSQNRGIGAVGRVSETSQQTGIVNFSLEDGGFGYTLNSDSIVSEKVMTLKNVNTTDDYYFDLLSEAYQPLINISYTGQSPSVNETFTRYVSGNAVSSFDVLSVAANTFVATPVIGSIANNAVYYSQGNTFSITISNTANYTISGKVMGLPNTVTIEINNKIGEFSAGDAITQGFNSSVNLTGTVTSVGNNSLVIENFKGVVYNSTTARDNSYTVGTGTISASNNSLIVTGTGTNFSSHLIGSVLYESTSNNQIGTIVSVANTTSLSLESRALSNLSGASYAYAYPFRLISDNASATVSSVSFDIGLYNIRQYTHDLQFVGASSNNILNEPYIIQKNYANEVFSVGKVISASYSANTGSISYIPIYGYFSNGSKIQTLANNFVATVSNVDIETEGGDFIVDEKSYIMSSTGNTKGSIDSVSFGFGAGFDIGSLSDVEQVFVGTDVLNSNNVDSLDYNRYSLQVSSNTGFSIGSYVVQSTDIILFNPSGIDANTGFIPVSNANTYFKTGDAVLYDALAGNTAIQGMPNDFYQVVSSNSTGLILSYGYEGTQILNNKTSVGFANNVVSETGHRLMKLASGVVEDLGANTVWVKETWGKFGPTGGITTTTTTANSGLQTFPDLASNANILSVSSLPSSIVSNTEYMSVSLSGIYGFPKLATATLDSTIFNCLNFQEAQIGVISGLSNINPGTGYNKSPFVIAYDPLIALSEKDDYKLTLSGKTKLFEVGERVYQSNPDSIRYDLIVDGEISNNFVEHNSNFDARYDVTSNKLYLQGTELRVNANTDISANFISVSGFEDNDYVRYYTSTGNTVITGLSNNNHYYIVGSNSEGFSLASTLGGSVISITASSISETGHNFVAYTNPFTNGDMVIYENDTTTVGGLTTNTMYYVVNGDSYSISLSASKAGSAITLTANTNASLNNVFNIPGFIIGDRIYQEMAENFNANTDIASDVITLSPQPFVDGDAVNYYTSTGNTVITGLSNNTTYYVINSNTSTLQLANSVGGSALTLTPSTISESGHYLKMKPEGFIYSTSTNELKISGVTDHFNSGYQIKSFSNPYISSNVVSVDLISYDESAYGIVKQDTGGDVIYVKRLTYENTFKAGSNVIGQKTGAEGLVVAVDDDKDDYPIGLNAIISANASTANGQISQIQIIDSGFGYSNNEPVTIGSGINVASGKAIIDGLGIGKGYYKDKRGFLSNDSYLHDGYYYQEYSYEIFSAIPVDKYADMFKKVMHAAGTKFFGSVLVEDQDGIDIEVIDDIMDEQVQFDPYDDVNNNKIFVGLESEDRSFNASYVVNNIIPVTSNPFSNNDLVQYYTSFGNTAITGLSNNAYYYAVNSSSNTGIQLSTSIGGPAISLVAGLNEIGHNLVSYKNAFSNNDTVLYSTKPLYASTFELDFASNETLDPRITFTRNSIATRVNANGQIETVSANVPRFDYDPVTHEPKGLLIEATRTNLFTQSGFPNGTDDTTLKGGGISNTTFEGFPGAIQMERTVGVTTYAYKSGLTSGAGTVYTISVFVQMEDGSEPSFVSSSVTSPSNDFWFNLGGSTILTSDIITIPMGNGVYRVIGTGTSGAGNYGGVVKSTTNSDKKFKVTGFQLEAATFATSYIPTGATAVTRQTDFAQISGTNFTDWYNPSEGSFVIEAQQPNVTGYVARALSVDDGTTNNRMQMAISTTGNQGYTLSTSGGVAQNSDTNGSFAVGSKFYSAMSYKTNDFAFSTNGAAPFTDTTYTLPTVNRLSFTDNNGNLQGYIRKMKYYPVRLPNDVLSIYSTGQYNVPVDGLTSGSIYYAANTTPIDMSLASEPDGSIINIEKTISDMDHYLTRITDEHD